MRIVSQQASAEKLPDYVDVAISFSSLVNSEFVEQARVVEEIRPYVSKGYLERHPNQSPDLLLESPLIHVDHAPSETSYPDWPEWFVKNGIEEQPTGPQVHVELVIMGLHACLSGQGYALISNLLANSSVQREEIIAPFERELLVSLTRTIFNRRDNTNPFITAFLDWMNTKLT